MQDMSLDNDYYKIEEISDTYNGKKYRIIARIPMLYGWIEDVKFVVEGIRDFKLFHKKNESEFAYFENEIELPTRAIFHYYFLFHVHNKTMYIKNNGIGDSILNSEKMKISINFDVPDWAKGKIMYHIFVDRFKKSGNDDLMNMPRRTIHNSWDEEMIIGPNEEGIWNCDFYGGNLKGIEESLDYIKSLGASIIYLSPILWSQSNHRYDTSDFELVDPYVGSNDDLKSLCNKAHSKGIKVILDAVFNHTGNDSKYFNELGSFNNIGAFQSKESIYYPFFKKYYANGKTYFDYWWGMKNLPVCDGSSKEWQEYIYGKNGIVDLWFSLGIDGLRLDVADELSDEFIEGIRRAVKRNKEDGFILGEVWKNPMRMNRGYIESGKGMDSVMNYTLMDALIRYFKYSDTYKLNDIINQIKYEYPKDTIFSLMNFTSTHDISRAINIFGSNEFQLNSEWAWNLKNEDVYWAKNYHLCEDEYKNGKSILKSYLFTLAFLPGILSIFYGDEVGLMGMGNLSNRKPFPWNNIDVDVLKSVKYIGWIRNKEKFLEKADLNVVDINNDYFAFERISNSEKTFTIVNRTDKILYLPNFYDNPNEIYTLDNSDVKKLMPHGTLSLKKIK